MVFASAAHGWAFDLRVFAEPWAKKTGHAGGDAAAHAVAGRVLLPAQGAEGGTTPLVGQRPSLKPMFVMFVLVDEVAYGALLTEPDAALRDKIVKSLGLSVPEREAPSRRRPRPVARRLRRSGPAVGQLLLRDGAERRPRAAAAPTTARLPRRGRRSPTPTSAPPSSDLRRDAAGGASLGALRAGVERCDAAAPVVAYVAKMVYVGGASGAHADDVFIAFARVFSRHAPAGAGGVLHVRLHGGGGPHARRHEERGRTVDGCGAIPISSARARAGGGGGGRMRLRHRRHRRRVAEDLDVDLMPRRLCPPFEPMAV